METHTEGHHAPDVELFAFKQIARGKLGVGRAQDDLFALPVEDLHQRLVVERGDDDFALLRFPPAIDDEYVPVENTDVNHAVAVCARQVGVRRADVHQLIERERAFHVILRRAGEAGGHTKAEKRQGNGGWSSGPQEMHGHGTDLKTVYAYSIESQEPGQSNRT